MQKGMILSSFSWGYLLSPVGGLLATKVGGSLVFSVGLAMTAFLTLVSPFFARLSIKAFVGVRVVEGVAEVSTTFWYLPKAEGGPNSSKILTVP